MQFATSFKERVTQGKIASAVAQVPLAAGQDFERTIALFEKLHRMGDRFWFAIELAGIALPGTGRVNLASTLGVSRNKGRLLVG